MPKENEYELRMRQLEMLKFIRRFLLYMIVLVVVVCVVLAVHNTMLSSKKSADQYTQCVLHSTNTEDC